MRLHGRLVAVGLAVTACGGPATRSPLAVARQYRGSVLRGDRLVAYASLTARDTAALTRDAFVSGNHEGLIGPPSTVDSAVSAPGGGGDTAIVYVYGRRPNYQAVIASALIGGLTGLATDSAAKRRRIQEQVRAAPLVTYVDTTVLLREGRRWSVWLGVVERRPLDSLATALSRTYLKVPLADRAAKATEWLQIAARLPRVLVPSSERAAMDTIVMEHQVVESLTGAGAPIP